MSTISKAGGRFLKTGQKLRPTALPNAERLRKEVSIPLDNLFDPVQEEDRFTEYDQWKFFPGDRVLITKGENKGKISKVISFSQVENKLVLEDSPVKKAVVPKFHWNAGSTGYINDIPMSVSIDDVKLVAKIQDETSGAAKDVVVHKFEFKGRHFNKDHQAYLPTRVVKHKGETYYLPWPVPEEKPDKSAAANQDVNSERTYFVDSVVHNQIPEAALNTIRNPKSKYRRGVFEQRHLNKFVAPEMPLSSVKKAYLEELEAKKKQGHNKLTPDLKDFIGGKVKNYIEIQKKTLGIN